VRLHQPAQLLPEADHEADERLDVAPGDRHVLRDEDAVAGMSSDGRRDDVRGRRTAQPVPEKACLPVAKDGGDESGRGDRDGSVRAVRGLLRDVGYAW
jgi:hypothetical protein